MDRSYLFLADGFEEIEALTILDIMRRAGLDVATVSINESADVMSTHDVPVKADMTINDEQFDNAGWYIVPGGQPGSDNLAACSRLSKLIKQHAAEGRKIAAICAAPAVVLAPLGVLKGYEATCYPGFEDALKAGGAKKIDIPVVTDRNIITANGPGAAMELALAIVAHNQGEQAAKTLADALQYNKDC